MRTKAVVSCTDCTTDGLRPLGTTHKFRDCRGTVQKRSLLSPVPHGPGPETRGEPPQHFNRNRRPLAVFGAKYADPFCACHPRNPSGPPQ